MWFMDVTDGERSMRVDVQPAIDGGNERSSYAENAELRNYGGAMAVAKARNNHRVGAVGEFASATFYGRPWGSTVGDTKSIDVDNIFEVRTRLIEPRKPLPDLALRPHDKLDLPHLLVRITADRRQAIIVGWLLARDGIARAHAAKADGVGWWCAPRGVWYVPPPYHSPKSFQDWLDTGAPKHVADDYPAREDMALSYADCLAAVRERVAAGGPGWEPK